MCTMIRVEVSANKVVSIEMKEDTIKEQEIPTQENATRGRQGNDRSK